MLKIYSLSIVAVDCKWGKWNIGECSEACGPGVRTNTRSKTRVEANGGACPGKSTETENCEVKPCDDLSEYPSDEDEGSGEREEEVTLGLTRLKPGIQLRF